MKIEFESTLDDAVEEQVAKYRATRFMRTDRWAGLLLWVMLTFGFLYFLIPQAGIALPAGLAVVLGTLAWLMGLGYARLLFRHRLRRILTEMRRSTDPIRYVIEIGPEHVRAEWHGIQLSCPWREIDQVVHNRDKVRLSFKGLAEITVPLRAFETPEQAREFLAACYRYRDEAGGVWDRVGSLPCSACGYNMFGTGGEVCPECGGRAASPSRDLSA